MALNPGLIILLLSLPPFPLWFPLCSHFVMAGTCLSTILLPFLLVFPQLLWNLRQEYTIWPLLRGLGPPLKTYMYAKYQNGIACSLVSLENMLSDDIVSCCNPSCSSHQVQIEKICNQFVNLLTTTAGSTIPGTGTGWARGVDGWSQ